MFATAALLAAAAFTPTSVAADGTTTARQRVSITDTFATRSFVLTPTTTGATKPDSGTFTDCCWSHRVVTRDGQRIEIDDPLTTYTGKRGTFVIRFRIEWLNAGNGYTVGTATWKLVRGTGAYAQITGVGHSAHAWPPSGYAGGRLEGFLGPR
jgi:hypothetical protein